MSTFTIVFDRETDGRWIAEIQEIPGALAYGGSQEEAKVRVQALALHALAERIEHGEPASGLDQIVFAVAV